MTTAAAILGDLDRSGVTIQVDAGNLVLSPASAIQPDLLDLVRSRKADLLSALVVTTEDLRYAVSPGEYVNVPTGTIGWLVDTTTLDPVKDRHLLVDYRNRRLKEWPVHLEGKVRLLERRHFRMADPTRTLATVPPPPRSSHARRQRHRWGAAECLAQLRCTGIGVVLDSDSSVRLEPPAGIDIRDMLPVVRRFERGIVRLLQVENVPPPQEHNAPSPGNLPESLCAAVNELCNVFGAVDVISITRKESVRELLK